MRKSISVDVVIAGEPTTPNIVTVHDPTPTADDTGEPDPDAKPKRARKR